MNILYFVWVDLKKRLYVVCVLVDKKTCMCYSIHMKYSFSSLIKKETPVAMGIAAEVSSLFFEEITVDGDDEIVVSSIDGFFINYN